MNMKPAKAAHIRQKNIHVKEFLLAKSGWHVFIVCRVAKAFETCQTKRKYKLKKVRVKRRWECKSAMIFESS